MRLRYCIYCQCSARGVLCPSMMVMVTVMVMITYYGSIEYDHYLLSRTLVSGQSTFHSIFHFTLYSILILLFIVPYNSRIDSHKGSVTVQYNRTVLDANNKYPFVFKTANYVLPVYVDPPEEIEHSSNLRPADRTGGQMEELKWED